MEARTEIGSMTGKTGAVLWLLRAEGAAAAALALYLYFDAGQSGWLLVALILLPDLSMLGYLAGPRLGALCYNAAHTYLAPALAWAVLSVASAPFALPVALVWVAHIGIDRLLGYGLKFPDAFRRTHLTP
jgi:hypothetical protein